MIRFLAVILFLTQFAHSRELTHQQKLNDLNELVGHIKGGYGPLEYKKRNFGLDVDLLAKKYAPLIEATKSNSEFYYLIVKFVAEFNDSHFGASLPTNFETSLGFSTDLVQDKVVIDEIDRKILSEEKFPFAKGDVLVSLNGKPIQQELDELSQYMGQGYELSARRKAAGQISNRRASKVPAQSGKVKVEVRRGNSLITETVEVEWQKKGEFVDEFVAQKKMKGQVRVNYDMISLEESFRCSGNSRIKIPGDATMIMDKPFVAYYYPTAKGNIGYLRLPHYSPTETDPRVNADDLRFKQYEFAVKVLEKNTVGLIIDQDHNCGGSVEWLHRIVSLFMDRPVAPMQFELLASKSSYIDFKSWVEETSTNTIENEDIQVVLNLIKDTWLNTTNFLTTKTSVVGNTEIYPNPVRYTKPIIVLIDEMSGSGGDAFPSLMQGYGRAKLLGTRTMGAGGHVAELPSLNNSQIKLRMTKSLFYRPDGVPVENNGAHPDIPYSPSVNDFKYGYQEYQSFFTQELLKLL